MIYKRPGSEAIAEFCRTLTKETGAKCTLVIVLDPLGRLERIGSDAFPYDLPEAVFDDINEALARISRGEGLQS